VESALLVDELLLVDEDVDDDVEDDDELPLELKELEKVYSSELPELLELLNESGRIWYIGIVAQEIKALVTGKPTMTVMVPVPLQVADSLLV